MVLIELFCPHFRFYFFFFFNDTATTEIYTLSLHDALPISRSISWGEVTLAPLTPWDLASITKSISGSPRYTDRKSTRLNSSHSQISYAVFCLKKKKVFNSKTEIIDEIIQLTATSHTPPVR